MGVFLIICIFISIFLTFYVIAKLRIVVPTNEVHIVQKKDNIMVYGNGFEGGNVYLNFADWVPEVGILVKKLSINIICLELKSYKVYDSEKIPFEVDLNIFFEIKNPKITIQKVDNILELKNQINEILKGVVIKVMSSKNIVDIIELRTKIKKEIYDELFNVVELWGINLLNIEFIDIRDADNSEVIFAIMMKKRSRIESKAMIENAENQRIIKVFGSIEKVLEKDRELKLKEEDLNKREIEIIKKENLIYKEILENKGNNNFKNKDNSIIFS